jgi:hypothetical protein
MAYDSSHPITAQLEAMLNRTSGPDTSNHQEAINTLKGAFSAARLQVQHVETLPEAAPQVPNHGHSSTHFLS